MAKEGYWSCEDGRAVVAADELYRQDPYDRIDELEARLSLAETTNATLMCVNEDLSDAFEERDEAIAKLAALREKLAKAFETLSPDMQLAPVDIAYIIRNLSEKGLR